MAVGTWRYQAELIPGEERGWIELDYRIGARRFPCRVELITTKPRLGGRRWWFVCPAGGRRVGRLHLPLVGPATVWAGRRAHGLEYASQGENRWARSARRVAKGVARLQSRPPSGNELAHRSVLVAPRLVTRNGGERTRRTIGLGGFAFVAGAGCVDLPPKPWKMRWATYQKRVNRIL